MQDAVDTTQWPEEQKLADSIFQSKLDALNQSTNKIFSRLLILQWIFCMILVAVVSPHTWIGTTSSVHIHLWSAVFLGALLTVYPVWLGLYRSKSALTPHVISIAQMGWSALLIHVTGGRIETHFHVFGSLAFLAFYRDWKVMCTASVVVILDHMIRGMWWPQSVFGMTSGVEWRWLEHAGWVVFENVFLISSCYRGRQELVDTAVKQAQLELSFRRTEIEVETRTQQLRVANKLADAASKAKSEFLANMSHEIRTPLTAILGYADLLRDDASTTLSTADRSQTIETIRNAGQHLLTVINDILDLSKIEANRMTVEKIKTPLVRILAEVESLIRPRAAGKGVSLNVKLATPIPSYVLSDPTRLRQILMNLMGNAAKFTQQGTIVLVAGVERLKTGPRLVIDVKDTGPGMTAEQAASLFVPFAQADTTVSRNHGGTGLGLSISRRLARLLGGEVILTWTELGRGSCFRVELPLQIAEGSTDVSSMNVLRVEPRRVANSPQSALSGRILLAEDGPDNQRLIRYYLQKAGAEVDVADNGRIALEMFETAQAAGRPYTLLLTDMQMPEMDGYTLARKLRLQGSCTSIVALTAHAMAEDRQRCMDAGCNDYATKPIDRVALIETCRRWMESEPFYLPQPATESFLAPIEARKDC